MAKRLSALLLCFLLVASPATATEYIITEQQLTRLEVNLKELKQLNEQLQKDLEALHQRSKEQEQSLMSVNISFNEYAASQQAKLRKTKAERNALLVILVGYGAALLVKK